MRYSIRRSYLLHAYIIIMCTYVHVHSGLTVSQRRVEVIRRLPRLKKLDSHVITEQEMEDAKINLDDTNV